MEQRHERELAEVTYPVLTPHLPVSKKKSICLVPTGLWVHPAAPLPPLSPSQPLPPQCFHYTIVSCLRCTYASLAVVPWQGGSRGCQIQAALHCM